MIASVWSMVFLSLLAPISSVYVRLETPIHWRALVEAHFGPDDTIVLTHSLFAALCQYAFGRLSLRLGHRRLLRAALRVYVLATLSLCVLQAIEPVRLARLLQAASCSAILVCTYDRVAASTASNVRRLVPRMMLAKNVCLALLPSFAMRAPAALSWGWIFVILAASAVAPSAASQHTYLAPMPSAMLPIANAQLHGEFRAWVVADALGYAAFAACLLHAPALDAGATTFSQAVLIGSCGGSLGALLAEFQLHLGSSSLKCFNVTSSLAVLALMFCRAPGLYSLRFGMGVFMACRTHSTCFAQVKYLRMSKTLGISVGSVYATNMLSLVALVCVRRAFTPDVVTNTAWSFIALCGVLSLWCANAVHTLPRKTT